ncbi:MAG: molybdopterin cofactor-binding domain-containing protein, partial [Woeseiaceae bacterium]|nr:molybdopterin cofactor-binding domain-containing protein [Woeseiaceae bacterium]
MHTTLAALVAEELGVTLDDINVEHGPASKAYYNRVILEEAVPFAQTDFSKTAERMRGVTHIPAKFLAFQVTGGSTSIPDAYDKMRIAGAAAREVLLEAAAVRLGVDKSTLTAKRGAVVSAAGERIAYTELALDAADIELPADPPLKSPSEWRILGQSQQRVDIVAKSTGTAEYSIDTRLPGMLYATVKMNPRLGAPMHGYDGSRAEAMPGVKKIVELDGGVAVVATNTWLAFRAADAIDFDWGDAPYPDDTDGHFDALVDAFANDPDSENRDDGDVGAALAEGADLEGEYRVPYLAHATMEPLNAVAWLNDDQLDVWAGSQAPTQALKDAATITGLDEDHVRINTTYMGGGFGRRSETDFIKMAVQVAQAMPGTPVKTTWSREEDMRHDTYRPPAIARFRATVADGLPTALDIELASPSIMASQMPRIGMPAIGPDVTIVQAGWDQPYGIANYRVAGYRSGPLMPLGYWRSVGASQNGFFHESIIDEIAHAAGSDPLDMRIRLMTHGPSRKVLEAVGEMANWGGRLPAGHAQGVAFVLSFGVPVAEIVEVANTPDGIRIVRVYAAVDVGTALDPRNIEGQVQSGVNFGLAAAMMGEITIEEGAVVQGNFNEYDAIRIHQAPDIEVRILENGERIRGIGEPGTPPAAPALATAIYAATGRRIRELPLAKHVSFAGAGLLLFHEHADLVVE